MSGYNLPDHVSARDFDDPQPGLCPVPGCDHDTFNNDGESWTACDTCAQPCACCGELLGTGSRDARGWCFSCVINEEVWP